jgi:nitrogenase iron protein NifH
MQVGCSPKVDSTVFLLEGKPQIENILEYSRTVGINETNIYDVIVQGAEDVWCTEAGGPAPAEGCAGRGVSLALDLLKKYGVYEKLGVNMVVYDVIADVVFT